MNEPAALLKQARDLFQQGQAGEAEEIVTRLVRDNPRDATALNFRAYLLYRRGRLEDALAAYRRLTEIEPRVAGHLANLGLICFKAQRYPEARAAFERLLELQPGDRKTLRNLGFCHERQESLEQALDCFTRAEDEENAARVRARLVRGTERSAPPGDNVAAPPRPAATRESSSDPDLFSWLDKTSVPLPGAGPELVRIGSGEMVVQVREKIYVNPAYCVGHRGVVVFAPAFREAEKAGAKFGGRRGVLARAEGNGELVLSGAGRGLLGLHLGGGRIYVNYAALVLCGTEVEVRFETAGMLKERFLAVELHGSGAVVLAVRGNPVVLPVPADLPTLARPEAVVAWTEHLGHEAETSADLKKLLGKDEALRYRFEGRGYLVLHSG